MVPQALELQEVEALQRLLSDPLYVVILKKFFSNHEEYYTLQSRSYTNSIPNDLHQQARNSELAKQFAAMAKAYGTAWAELEKAADQ